MKKRNEDGWPRAPPNRTLPALGLAITVAAHNRGDASAAATEDDDDGGRDKTPAASTAGAIQGPRQPQYEEGQSYCKSTTRRGRVVVIAHTYMLREHHKERCVSASNPSIRPRSSKRGGQTPKTAEKQGWPTRAPPQWKKQGCRLQARPTKEGYDHSRLCITQVCKTVGVCCIWGWRAQ